MSRFSIKMRALPFLFLAGILIAVQSVALAHSYDHESGLLNHQVCATCIAAHNLSSTCIDNVSGEASLSWAFTNYYADPPDFRSVHTLCVRQRGPPLSL